MIGTKTVTLRFRVNWLLCIGGGAGLLIAAFLLLPDGYRPVLIFIASVLAGASALMAAVNAIDARMSQLQQAKALAALDFIHRWNAPEFYYAKKAWREVALGMKELKTPMEQRAYLDEQDRLTNVVAVLNFLESLGNAVRLGIADEETARRFFQSILLDAWHRMEPFVKNRRAERQNARLLQDLEWLFNRWKD